MTSVPLAGRIFGAAVATLVLGVTSIAGASPARKDFRAKVVSVELRRDTEGERFSLRLQVRNFRSGDGQLVYASHGDLLENQVFAKRVRGSYRQWRIGQKSKEGRNLLAYLADGLERKGVVRVDAGVPATAPSGGKLSHFRIKGFNEPTPALGALPN